MHHHYYIIIIIIRFLFRPFLLFSSSSSSLLSFFSFLLRGQLSNFSFLLFSFFSFLFLLVSCLVRMFKVERLSMFLTQVTSLHFCQWAILQHLVHQIEVETKIGKTTYIKKIEKRTKTQPSKPPCFSLWRQECEPTDAAVIGDAVKKLLTTKDGCKGFEWSCDQQYLFSWKAHNFELQRKFNMSILKLDLVLFWLWFRT